MGPKMKILQWILLNSAFLCVVIIGAVYGNHAAINVMKFFIWVMFITSIICAIDIDRVVSKEMSKIFKNNPKYYAIIRDFDPIYDIFVTAIIAYSGQMFFYAALYFMHTIFQCLVKSNTEEYMQNGQIPTTTSPNP